MSEPTVYEMARKEIAAIQTETAYWDDERTPQGIKDEVLGIIDAALAAAPEDETLDIDEIAARFHDSRYGVFAVHDGTGTAAFVEPVVACGYCRRAAERYVYAASERSRLLESRADRQLRERELQE